MEKFERVVEGDEEFHGRRYAEAQMPLPPTPPPESPKLPPVDPPKSDSEHQPAIIDKGDISPPVSTDPLQTDPEVEADLTSATISSVYNADGDPANADVDALRQQLKRFKERFTGSEVTYVDLPELTG